VVDKERKRRLSLRRRRVDIIRARGALNRESRTLAREGLKKTLSWLAPPSERVRQVY
jgi:nucleoside-diphosphate-sugar epimerase